MVNFTSQSQLNTTNSGRRQAAEEESEGVPSARTNLLLRMFELASDATKTDHPLCVECTTLVSNELDEALREAEREFQAYSSLLKQLDEESRNMPTEAFIENEILMVCDYSQVDPFYFH